ncbi:outer membrane protein assembly factor BamD [Granulicella arctica]|uniref:Outer membrane protein assembly factor BamD n=1 Tax=Granulicella arctica TaxID=940613 RepID=A0A7Y9PG13_9BACT|nr:outer membrane protein assembly factor BamD [Granulicella arctica]NYF79157.1 outer membrane protein assembly factor BamD [Granulicella arctica]
MMKHSFFPSLRAGLLAGVAVAAMFSTGLSAGAQATESNPSTAPAPAATTAPQPQEGTMNANPAIVPEKKKLTKDEKRESKVIQSKDTKKQLRKDKKNNPLVGVDVKLPDKQLYDKAMDAAKRGHYDVARLDLQTLLNTYPDSEFQMRAKLAIADSWYKEGGTAALTQAESEYKDFITFFPNAPEAAEAQMRVGDIYFRQMDKPDRDYAKAKHAEEEYRLMLQQFPDSTLVPAAQQRLREVQEAMATRESQIGEYYSTHANWPATIARYQTVVDTYPLYSHMDDTLVGLGDAYEAEARYVRTLKLPEAGKARLEKIYDDQAAAAYRRVVLEHSAAPHVEDAKDRLAAMNLPIPVPTPEQVAASVALENSRAQYKLTDRVGLILFRKPDVVTAARIGDPPLTDPKATLAPTVTRQVYADFNSALNPNAAVAKPVAAPTESTPASATDASAAPAAAPAAPAAPLQLQDVPTAAGGSGDTSAVMTAVPGNSGGSSTGAGSNSLGVEIVSPSSAAPAAETPGGLKAVGPPNATPLPEVEKAAPAPDAVNDIKPGTQPAAQTPPANGKKVKPEFDKGDESSSKHKKKKGLDKLNPF